MKIFHYDETKEVFLDLSEVTISTDLKTLVEIRNFFNKSISMIESGKNFPDHLHLRDGFDGWNESNADIIVMLDENEESV